MKIGQVHPRKINIVYPTNVPHRGKTFAKKFCEQQGISPDRYADTVFAKTLHPHAHLIGRMIALARHDYFSPDLELIRSVAHLYTLKDFFNEANHYIEHPANRHWLRGLLKIRVSTTRLRKLFKKTMFA